jgi:hypothetical protein
LPDLSCAGKIYLRDLRCRDQKRTDEKTLARGSDHPRARETRIEWPAPADEGGLDRPVPRRGRPPLPPEDGKRYPLGIRTTKALRERILKASRASGRSLAQEIEFRLEQSFERDDFLRVVERRIRFLTRELRPRLLSRVAAADYCGLSLTTFEKLARPYVPPIHIGRRAVWDIRALDRWLDAQTGLANEQKSR